MSAFKPKNLKNNKNNKPKTIILKCIQPRPEILISGPGAMKMKVNWNKPEAAYQDPKNISHVIVAKRDGVYHWMDIESGFRCKRTDAAALLWEFEMQNVAEVKAAVMALV